jgi:hypothetical protein
VRYDVVLLSVAVGPIRSSLGFEVGSFTFDEASVDTLIVGGGMIGAGRHERTLERATYRNGYRDRSFDTRLSSLQLRIPKL